ncbi:uncharacterized protein LOC144151771 [Haemaphysalis longicornis]
MGYTSAMAALAFVAVSVAAMPNRKYTSCDFTAFDPYAAVSSILAKLPTHTKLGSQEFRAIFPGFEIGGLNVSGLHHIEQYGPALPFCVNESRVLQVDFIHRDNVDLSLPWRSCSGMEGSIRLSAELSRFTVQFKVVDSDAEKESALSFIASMTPVTVEGVYATVEGAGEALKIVAGVFSKVFDGILRETWNQVFFASFHGALGEALEGSLHVRSNHITP